MEVERSVLLTVAEVSERLGVSADSVYDLARRGALPSVKIGRSVRIPERALEAWIKFNTRGGNEAQ